jgi:hypothetical protein
LKLIEFTGLPGSGKSTIVSIVKKWLIERGFKVADEYSVLRNCQRILFGDLQFETILPWILSKLNQKTLDRTIKYLGLKKAYELRYIKQNLELYKFISAQTQARPLPIDHKNFTLNIFFDLAARYQIAFELLDNESILIFDEGFFHKVVNFFVSVEEDNINFIGVKKYLEKIPRIYTLIKIEANEDMCNERLHKRELPFRLKDKTDDEIFKYLVKAKSVIDYGVNYLDKRDANIISINNTGRQLFMNDIIRQISKEQLGS